MDIPVKPDMLLEHQGSEQLAPSLPDEERELISAIFSTDEVDIEPKHMYAPPSSLLLGLDAFAQQVVEPRVGVSSPRLVNSH